MVIILASSWNASKKDRKGAWYPVKIPDTNSFVSNLKKYIPKYDSAVFVANDPNACEQTESYANCVFQALQMTDLIFKKTAILDNRNKRKAKKIIENADLVILAGGRVHCQLKFFEEIGLKELVKNHRGLVLAGSASAMNLCSRTFNFPEEKDEVDDREGEQFFMKGLGFHNEVLIPHFDAEEEKYTRAENLEFDVTKEVILPLSYGREFIAFGDDSYILLSNDQKYYFGKFYRIADEKITERKPLISKPSRK